jgi:hypothetical protein
MSDTAASISTRSTAQSVSALVVLHAALISTLTLLFVWPAATAEPRDVPIGMVGPSAAVQQVGDRIDAQQEGALALIAFDSVDDARQAIKDRAVYGAIVLGEVPEALVATAASPAVAQLLTDLTRAIVESSAAQAGIPIVPVTVTDVVAFTEADSRGAVFGSLALPLVIGGISLAAMAALRLSSARARFALVGVASITTGLALTGIMAGWLGVLPGDVILTATAMSAALAAIAFSIVGAHALLGMAGFGTVAAVLFLLGNPLSGVALPPEFYLGGWGAVGQAMPVGAVFDLLRTISFFPSADATAPWLVLGTWSAAGVFALVIGGAMRRGSESRHPA